MTVDSELRLGFSEEKFYRSEVERALKIIEKVQDIGFDADGVVIGSPAAVARAVNRIFEPPSVTEEELIEWDGLVNFLMDKKGFDKRVAETFNFEFWHDEEILRGSTPIPSSRELFIALGRLGKRLHVITSREPFLADSTRSWFSRWRYGVPQRRIHIRENQEIGKHGFKAYKLLTSGIQLFVEDYPAHAKIILETDDELGSKDMNVILVPHKPGRPGYEWQHPRLIKLQSLDYLYHALIAA
jgi:hypothetical protein